MRLNKFIAHTSGLSRRDADQAIIDGRVTINSIKAAIGQSVSEKDKVTLDGAELKLPKYTYLLLNKPVDYVASRKGQSAKTIYSLLPKKYSHLKTVGRLDKDSCGIMLLSDDGDYANVLTHPSFKKIKIYRLRLDKFLTEKGMKKINDGIKLEDGISSLKVEVDGDGWYRVTMKEGRNRQIRRTFAAIGYQVMELDRTQFGPYKTEDLKGQQFIEVNRREI